MNFLFKPLSEQYAAEVMDIFNHYIENSFAAYFETKLPVVFFNKMLEITNGYPAYVLLSQDTGRVAGFCFLKPYSPMPVFGQTAEVSYFLSPDETGKGAGNEMLGALEEGARKMGVRHLLASISSLNEQSLRFHAKSGFRECGRLKNIGNKHSKDFDVVWMQKDI